MLFGMLIALYIRMVNKMIKNCLKGFVFIASILLPVALFAGPLPVDLGRACGFAALDGSGFTNTGNTVLNGDLGSFPTISETGLSTLTINGTDQAGDIYTQNAKTDLTAAYLDGSGRTVTATLAAELGGTTLTAGVYNTTAAFDITGTLTLDGGGDTNSVFILIAASTLTTADFSAVSLINGAQAGNVFWIIGSSASLGASTVFNGTIIAQDTITLVTNGSVAGRLLAINGQVILDTNTVGLANLCGMATATFTTTGTLTPTVTMTETPTAILTVTPSTTETLTVTGTNTATATETQNITQTTTPSITETATETGTGTNTATATETQNITQTITPSITETATETGTGTNTATATETQNITQTITPSITQTLSLTLTTTNTVTPSATVIQTSSVTPTITPSLTGTMTPVNGVDLGTSGNYAVLSSTFTRNGGITAITGDLGYTTLSGGGSHTVNGNTYTPAPPQSGLDQAAALVSLDNYGCTFSFADGAVDLASDTTHGLTGIYTPGVYCVNGAMSISGGAIITLNGKGIYIFRSTGAFTSSDNSKVVLTGGADACDIYWTPGQAVTLGADTVFVGTIIDASGITAGNNTAWTGRALAFGGTVTMDTDSIALPVCGITGTATNTPTATVTETLTLTATATLTETETFSFTQTGTLSATQTLTPSYTFTPDATATTVLTAAATASPTFTQTPSVSVSKTYPNPINPYIQDLNVVFILNGYSENVKMLIYTPAFRLVRDIEIGTVPAGKNIAVIPGSKLRGFARGIYYYSVIFKTDGGSETKCSIEKLEILY